MSKDAPRPTRSYQSILFDTPISTSRNSLIKFLGYITKNTPTDTYMVTHLEYSGATKGMMTVHHFFTAYDNRVDYTMVTLGSATRAYMSEFRVISVTSALTIVTSIPSNAIITVLSPTNFSSTIAHLNPYPNKGR